MLVTCAKCSSRYQIGDEKIKPTGTKVRCPRCQNTFRVFAQETPSIKSEPPPDIAPTPRPSPLKSHSPASDSTEFFQRSEDSIRKPSPERSSPFKTPSRETVTGEAFSPSGATGKEPSPFKRPVKPSFDLDEEDQSASEEANSPSIDDSFAEANEKPAALSKTRSEEESAPPKPFGDATFFALQKMAKPKGFSRRVLVAAAIVIVAAVSFFVITQGPTHRAPETAKIPTAPAVPQKALAFERPTSWYKDDPTVFQDFLAQTATRPPADQKRPETRALVAEALILNGLLNGADDQIASGLAMASSLIAAYPESVYGYYALATYAEWRDDIQTLSELVQKWPADRRSEPDYRVAQIIVDAHTKNNTHALDSAKAFLMEMPEHRRAQTLFLAFLLDAPDEIQKSFGDRLTFEMQKTYQKLRSTYSTNSSVPPVLKSIDKKIARKNLAAANAEPKETLKPTNETQKLNERSLKRLEERRKRLVSDAPTAPAPSPAPSAASSVPPPTPTPSPTPSPAPLAEAPKPKPAVDPKKLPKVSSDLVALNKETKREKTEAEKIFEQADELQKSNHLEEAIGLYQKTLRLNPDFAEVYKNLGVIYMNRADKDRALRNFKIYLQLKPQSEDKQIVEGWISSLQ